MAVKMRLFHLSGENLHGKFLYPRVPSNFMTKHGYEDSKTQRVSFSSSIDGALTGLSENIMGQIFFVHEPYSYQNLITVPTTTLIDKKLVPDAHLSKEVWVLNPVRLRLVSVVRVIDSLPTPLSYKYGNNLKAETYRWRYEKEGSTFVHLMQKT